MVVRLIGPIPIWHMSCDWLPISYYRQYSSCIPLQYSRLLLCCQNDPGNLSGKSQCPFSPIRPLFKSTLAPTWICFSVITELILSGVVVHSQLVCLLSLRILHLVMFHLNNSFLSPQAFLPSSKNPQFQNESRCKTFLVKLSFICMRMKNHFHIKGWALNLVLMERPGGTQKWPIVIHFLLVPNLLSRLNHDLHFK